MSFDEWQQYYDSYDAPAIIAESATFESSVPVNRMSAFLVRLMDIACGDPSLAYEERLKAATLAVTTAQLLLPTGAVEPALRATLDRLKTFSAYPAIAAVIEEGAFDQRNVVGLILAKLEEHEIDLLQRLVERGGSGILSGNRDHRKFDRLEKSGYIERRAIGMDAIEYVITRQGRDLLDS
jgi:hypothetical protein